MRVLKVILAVVGTLAGLLSIARFLDLAITFCPLSAARLRNAILSLHCDRFFASVGIPADFTLAPWLFSKVNKITLRLVRS